MAYIVVNRFQLASVQARNLLASLTQRVTQKEIELQQSYGQLEILARDQERSSERARILRDMHDGVGSHISAAIRQLQSGRASNADVLLTLRDSLDHLKLSIDAMTLPDGDVNALLASLRYRLAPRFKAIDIELVWDVDLLPVLDGLDAGAMRHLQYMLFEALSNVLQHAQATVLRIEAHGMSACDSGGADSVCLRVVDNGCGFEPCSVLGKGLAALQARANAIGASLRISSQPGQTVIEIKLGLSAAYLAA
ncbi:MAG: histidine kinase [Rhodoferax sp.]|nr:histidine kinase [Rhodoferax sp.]